MRKILSIIDSISDWTGRAVSVLVIGLVGLITYEVTARYVFNAPSIWGYQISIILAGSIYVLGWACAQVHGMHVRVDIIYSRLSLRSRKIIDVTGTLLLFFPLFFFLTKNSLSWVIRSVELKEVMSETFWYPPAFPFRAVVATGMILLFLQFTASFVRDLYCLIKGKQL